MSDEFDYEDSYGDSIGSNLDAGLPPKSRVVVNQPFDEAVELDESASLDESIDTVDGRFSPHRHGGASARRNIGGDSPPPDPLTETGRSEYEDEEEEETNENYSNSSPINAKQSRGGQTKSQEEESSSEEEEASPTGGQAEHFNPNGYNPAEYANLNVSKEIKDLFGYIGRYKPANIELETKIKPFIPDYIPSVGEIDAFVKIPRPDGNPDNLGLTVLDEPSTEQSDATVLDLQLRAVSKHSNLQPMIVRSIQNAEKNPKEISRWINSINELRKSKPHPTVNYSRAMPDIEQLMQVWPEDFEQALKQIPVPSAELDMSVEEYARLACALLDIPVYDNIIESLHLLFSLYSEFKANPYFSSQGPAGGPSGSPLPPGSGGYAYGVL